MQEPQANDDPATPVQGTYIAPGQRRGPGWKSAGAAAVGVGLLLTKAKALLLILLNFKWFLIGAKVLASSLTFLASVWLYALFWGWRFALVFMILILVHELGHALFMRLYGVPASMPYFIPGFGALITMKGRPASVLEEAYIAFAGPLIGSIAAFACFLYGEATGERFWLAIAYTGFFLNLFNLFPVMPLDGGRVVGAISPRVWIFGLVALVVSAIAFKWFNPLIFILVLLSIPQVVAAFKGQLDKRYFSLSLAQRGTVAACYFGLAALLFVGMLAARVPVPSQTFN